MTILLSAIFWKGCVSQKQKLGDNPPNIIIIFTDDQGYQDVGCFGSPDILTPNLDRLAKEGTRLTSFYAAQAVCSASRAALLTGCYPNRIGIHGAFMPKASNALDTSEVTIAEILKDIGYHTGIFGKWHLGDHPAFFPMNQGFDEFFGILYSNDMWPYHPWQGSVFNFDDLYLYEGYEIIDTMTDQSHLTVDITNRSVDFIKRNRDNPFFLYVPHPQPHVPLFVSEKFRGKSERGLYGDVIMEIDWSVGEIIRTLEEENLVDNTMVIFTSDNGPWLSYGTHSGRALPFREGKGTALEGGHREPFIVKMPGVIQVDQTIEEPTMAIDILPTIAELTGASLPSLPIDGKSILSLLRGDTQKSPQVAYYFYYHRNELHGIRFEKWKMYFPHRYRSLNGRDGGKDGLPVDYEYLTFDKVELYDLENDPGEHKDVSQLYPNVVEKINGLAAGIRSKLGDKLSDIDGTENRPPATVTW